MKKSLLLPSAFLLLLAGCTATTRRQESLEERLSNPLYAERYAEEMVDRMVEYAIRKDPLLEDAKKAKIIEETRKEWLEKGRIARKKQSEGYGGHLITTNEPIKGEVLYRDDTLFTDSTFATAPGPDLHFFITTMTDPRDGVFPDETAIDLGRLDSAFGAQAYAVPPTKDPQNLRTVVLWDSAIGKLYGFAQLTK